MPSGDVLQQRKGKGGEQYIILQSSDEAIKGTFI
jgi:hypothetical protein